LALKKQHFAEGEIPIFDEACIYKRGEYWQFRMWLPKENKYARKSLRTRSEATAIEKGKAAYLEIYANLQQGKTYFSITTKEGVEKYLNFCMRDVELGHIVKGRHTTIATHLQHFLSFIGKDTKLKELERTDCENYFYHRHKTTNTKVKQVTVQNEQSTINALMKWLHKSVTRTVAVPKTETVKQEPQQQTTPKDIERTDFAPIRAQPPLPNQRNQWLL